MAHELRARRAGWNATRIALMGFALLAVAALSLAYGPMINTGDWWRICPSGHFSAMGWQPLHTSYPLTEAGPTPRSALAVLVELGLYLQLAFGAQAYWTPLVFIALCAIFLGGCLVAVRSCATAADAWITAGVILVGALYGFYFKSFYQEATTLAFLPWFLGGLLALREGRPGLFVAATCLMLASKAENVFVIPVALAALWWHDYPRKAGWMAASLLAIAAFTGLAFTVQDSHNYSAPNTYNRYYSGIGWVSKGVAETPRLTFNGMRSYFYAQLPKSLENPQSMPPPGTDLMGTSYWPTGWALTVVASKGSPADKARLQDIMAPGRLGNFLGYFARHPGFVADYVRAALVVALRFDYDLSYIRTPGAWQAGPIGRLRELDLWVLGKLGYICLGVFALSLLAAARRGSAAGALLAVYFFVGAPLFCVLGDGYYEFEKHLCALWLFAPVILHLCITDFARPGRRASMA